MKFDNKGMHIMKKYIFVFVFLLFSHNSMAGLSRTKCGGDYAEDCKDCFINTSPLRLGYGLQNLTWEITTGDEDMLIYLDENPAPFKTFPFYTNGEIEIGPGAFTYASGAPLFKDQDGKFYLELKNHTTTKVLQSDKGFFLKFAKLTDAVKNNGPLKPLIQYQYIFKYYNKKEGWNHKTLKACILAYPAW